MRVAGFDRDAKRRALAEQVALPDELVEIPRAHSGRERRVIGPIVSEGNSSGSVLIDSAPPASTARAAPLRMREAASATASMPLAQLRCNVSPGTRCGTPV